MSASLDEFAEANPTAPGYRSYLDTLPDDIQGQLLSSKARHSTAEQWLRDQGYERATQQMIRVWRAKRGWSNR